MDKKRRKNTEISLGQKFTKVFSCMYRLHKEKPKIKCPHRFLCQTPTTLQNPKHGYS